VRENSPDEVVAGFRAALRAGDVGSAAAMFSRDGCFITPDATVIRERLQIRRVLQQLVEMVERLTIEQRSIVTAGDVAVSSEVWRMRTDEAGGSRHSPRSMIVLARVEGVWRIVVFDPWRG
jgi:ketosteroid isomerase-like protein